MRLRPSIPRGVSAGFEGSPTRISTRFGLVVYNPQTRSQRPEILERRRKRIFVVKWTLLRLRNLDPIVDMHES